MSETRSVLERGDELGRVLFEAWTLDMRVRCGVSVDALVMWDQVSKSEREGLRDMALAVAFAAVGGDAE